MSAAYVYQSAKDQEAIKESVRKRDGYKCADCGRTQTEINAGRDFAKYRALDVHRKDPHGVYSADDCVALCHRCHMRRHHRARKNGVGWGERIPDVPELEGQGSMRPA